MFIYSSKTKYNLQNVIDGLAFTVLEGKKTNKQILILITQ